MAVEGFADVEGSGDVSRPCRWCMEGMYTYSLTSGRFCVEGSRFSTPLLSQPWFLPALFELMETSCLVSTGESKNCLDRSNIWSMSSTAIPVSLFSMKTKPYLVAASSSCFGPFVLLGLMSRTGIRAVSSPVEPMIASKV